jgi:hypothetical protein
LLYALTRAHLKGDGGPLVLYDGQRQTLQGFRLLGSLHVGLAISFVAESGVLIRRQCIRARHLQ